MLNHFFSEKDIENDKDNFSIEKTSADDKCLTIYNHNYILKL